MSHIHIPSEIPTKYLDRGGNWKGLAGGMFVVGLVTFVTTLMSDADRAWQAYVSNWLFFTSVSMGAVIFTAATVIVKAKWNWPIRRIGLAFVAFLPIAFVLLLPMVFSLRESYFPWMEAMEYDYIVQKKQAYLNIPFLVTRNVLGAAALFGMAVYFAYLALRPDMGLTRGDAQSDSARTSWAERLTSGWRGQEAEEVRSWTRMSYLAPGMVLMYAVVMSIFSYDWVMSLEPHWFSTMMGPWFFMGAFWTGIAAITFTSIQLKKRDAYYDEAIENRQQLHDLGKLIFAFTVFWGYLFFSQYIVIWYGKLPWEQAWIINRSVPPWGALSLLAIVLCFVVPFASMLGRKPKMTPNWVRGVTMIIFAGLWLERYLMVAPSIRGDSPPFGIQEPLIGLMFLGLFFGSIRWFLSVFPVVQIWQHPAQAEMLEAEIPENVEAG